jgi:hypothetical protein
MVLVLAAVACTAAGCGSSTHAVSGGPITVDGSTTIANVEVGTLLRCKGGPSARVPHWFGGSALKVPGTPGQIALVHEHDGTVTVSCTRSG